MRKHTVGPSKSARIKTYYVVVLALLVLAVAVAGYELYTRSQGFAAGTFYKVSSQDYATQGQTDVYLVSWIGCPNGAVYSWSLYQALEHYGQLNYTMQYSNPNDAPKSIPGLIFSGFAPNSTVMFQSVYMYNEYLNETTTGKQVNASNSVDLGLGVVQSEAPSWVYNLVNKWIVAEPATKLSNGTMVSLSYGDQKLPHVVTTLLVSGSRGTWLVAGAIYPPSNIAALTTTQLMGYVQNGTIQQQVPEAYDWAGTFASVIADAS